MNHHHLAAISIAGSCLDVLGSLYLAYDLLGGQHGPLRLVTRMVTYAIVFGIGLGLGLGLFFGVVAGVTLGITAAIEINHESRGLGHYSLPWEALFASIRGFAFGVGLYHLVGLAFAAAFTALNVIGQVVGYSRGVRPGMDYSSARRPRFTHRMFTGTLVRSVGYFVSALVCSAFVQHVEHPLAFAIRIGLTIGIVSGVGMAFNPYIEYYADNLPQRWMGTFGVALIFCGFLLQSLQYWLTLFDIPIS